MRDSRSAGQRAASCPVVMFVTFCATVANCVNQAWQVSRRVGSVRMRTRHREEKRTRCASLIEVEKAKLVLPVPVVLIRLSYKANLPTVILGMQEEEEEVPGGSCKRIH